MTQTVGMEGIAPVPRSPSPPSKAPISKEPGPRAEKLTDVFNRALTHTISTCSYAHFASCFPTADKYNKPLLESVWRQVTNMIETRSRREFDEIFTEKDVIRGLNELDSVIAEAEERKANGEEPMTDALHEVSPQQLFLAHLAPQLDAMSSRLDTELTSLQLEDEQLIQNIKAQEQEIDSMVRGLEGAISDLEGATIVLHNATTDSALRTGAIEIDSEISRRQDGQSSRL